MLLILAQNVYAKTDAEYDKMITNESDKVWKQLYRCNKAALNHKFDSDVNICLKAIDMVDKNRYVLKEGADESNQYINAGVLYEFSKKDYITVNQLEMIQKNI